MRKPVLQSVRGVLLLLLLAVCVKARPAGAQVTNFLTNPGFETGSTSPWFAFGSPTLTAENTVVHSGSYACEVTGRSATYMGAAQSLVGLLSPGQTYSVSGWLRLVSGTNQTMQLTMQKTDGSGTTYSNMANGTVTSSGWTQFTGSYTYNPSGTPSALNFYAEMPSSASNSYYIDDVTFDGTNVIVSNLPPINGTSTVDWNNVHQRIDGFGASSAWNSSWTASEAAVLYSTNNNISYQSGTYNGVGLSLLRTRIAAASSTASSAVPTTVENQIMVYAQGYGAKVWSTPWTPASGFKDSDTPDGGNYLGSSTDAATNIAYASQLANYVLSMKSLYGVNIYAISVQNEPDGNHPDPGGYESCVWQPQQFHDFVPYLSSAFAAASVSSTKIMLPESQNWTDPQGLASIAMNDPSVAADVSIIANHDYVTDNGTGDQTVPAAIPSYGKALWETEVALLSGSDSSIANGVYYAQRIHLYMTQAQANAYHYWWLVASGSDNEGLLTTTAAVTKRLFAFGQYSRFVRPNYYRINATSSLPSALISAYKDSASPNFAIVAVNTNPLTPINQTFNLANFSSASVTPWITSATLNLAPQPATNIIGGSLTYTLPPQSIVTFVGVGQTNTPPTIASVPNQNANVGVTLLVTNTASASDVPPQTLSFAPGNNLPFNATLNSSSGVFSWRPLVSQANTTNVIKIQVTDSDSSHLSATNSFNVIVNPVTNPVLSALSLSHGQVSMTASGPQGPDYTLWTSTNLINWQALYTTNSPVTPFMLVDTNSTNQARFYKIQIGP